jgi:hypothetical protein
MPEAILELDDLEITTIDAEPGREMRLELLVDGLTMTETGASSISSNVYLCSCCCCC